MIQRHCKEARLRFGKVEHVDEGYFPRVGEVAESGEWRSWKLKGWKLDLCIPFCSLVVSRSYVRARNKQT